jgi:hypothetical protein
MRRGIWPAATATLQVRDLGRFLSQVTYGTLRVDLARPPCAPPRQTRLPGRTYVPLWGRTRRRTRECFKLATFHCRWRAPHVRSKQGKRTYQNFRVQPVHARAAAMSEFRHLDYPVQSFINGMLIPMALHPQVLMALPWRPRTSVSLHSHICP